MSYSRALPFLLPPKTLPGAPGCCLQPLDTHGAAAPSRQDERRAQEGTGGDSEGEQGSGLGLPGVRAHSQAGLTWPFPEHLQLEEPSERGERAAQEDGGILTPSRLISDQQEVSGLGPLPPHCVPCLSILGGAGGWIPPSTIRKMGGTRSQVGGAA